MNVKINIKNKLYISAGISIILIIIVSSLALVTSKRIIEGSKRNELLDNVRAAITELNLITYDYLLHREKRMEEQWNLRYNSMAELLEDTEKEEAMKLIHSEYASLSNLFSQVVANYQNTQKLIQEGASQKEIDSVLHLEEGLVSQLLIRSYSIATEVSKLTEQVQSEVLETQKIASNTTLILMLVLAVTVATTSSVVARSILKPLNELTRSTEIIGKGNLEHKVDVKTKDELSQLAAAFNKMTKNLKETTTSRDELNKEVAERKRAEKEVLIVNNELSIANKELEAFSYSVSHDLRAPLRHISGFVELLQKNTPFLDETSVRYLNNIHNSAKLMGNLIDDLLEFSRVGRYEMKKSEIDVYQLVKDVLKEFAEETNNRKIYWKIADLPKLHGDQSMIRLVFTNLISNAVKFTRNCKQPVIEIGYNDNNSDYVFFIKDNGIGFEMEYANKLFNVFQRLHRQDEFEGTGIGLASVRRIINRHRGKTWAEGEVNRGATFYFSLPKN